MNYSSNDIKLLRKEYNLTQRELGERLGVKYRTIQSWESEKRNIPDSMQIALNHLNNQLQQEKLRQQLIENIPELNKAFIKYISEDTLAILDKIDKKEFIAYLLAFEADFASNSLYQIFLEKKLTDAKLKWEAERLLKK